MREILFKGKRGDNGEWVEGNLFIPDDDNRPTEICIGTDIVRITYAVDPDTISQFTGLYDKNGERIYDNDILALRQEFGIRIKYTYIVVYFADNGCLCSSYYKNKKYNHPLFNEDGEAHISDFEIVGNLFDNPELLERNNG